MLHPFKEEDEGELLRPLVDRRLINRGRRRPKTRERWIVLDRGQSVVVHGGREESEEGKNGQRRVAEIRCQQSRTLPTGENLKSGAIYD